MVFEKSELPHKILQFFPKYFLKFSGVLIKNVWNYFRYFSKYFLKFSKILHKIFYRSTSSPGKLRFALKCILGEWLYNVTKGVVRVYTVSKCSASFSKVCGNNCPRWSVQSGHMVAECGVKLAASSLRPKITKKVQFAPTMGDQITAGQMNGKHTMAECCADCSPC